MWEQQLKKEKERKELTCKASRKNRRNTKEERKKHTKKNTSITKQKEGENEGKKRREAEIKYTCEPRNRHNTKTADANTEKIKRKITRER